MLTEIHHQVIRLGHLIVEPLMLVFLGLSLGLRNFLKKAIPLSCLRKKGNQEKKSSQSWEWTTARFCVGLEALHLKLGRVRIPEPDGRTQDGAYKSADLEVGRLRLNPVLLVP